MLGVLLCSYPPCLSVEIGPCQRTTIIADNNPVWIQHGHNLEYKLVTEGSGLQAVRGEVI